MLREEDYCDYEASVALKELGYVGSAHECECFGAYFNLGKDIFTDSLDNTEVGTDEFLRVPLYLAQKWLREELNIIVEVFVDDDSDTPITYNIHKDGECVFHHHGRYFAVKDWNLALLEGIKEAIKILKEERKCFGL